MSYEGAPSVRIRKAMPADAAPLRALRIRGLREHPEAFLMPAHEQEQQSVEEWAERLGGRWGTPDNLIVVAERGGELVGLVGYYREQRDKARHRVTIWGTYVAPEARGGGTGRALMEDAIERVRALGDVTHLHLGVTVVNTTAHALYESLGFETWGVEPAAMRLDGRDLDEAHMVMLLD